ncbi:hypothetical protein FOA52_014690 [Chlamydomonas sp. UWO 241]|nr:hypothetical protein FOA52_014690 [Chlamydomonas sp. UWO 241]
MGASSSDEMRRDKESYSVVPRLHRHTGGRSSAWRAFGEGAAQVASAVADPRAPDPRAWARIEAGVRRAVDAHCIERAADGGGGKGEEEGVSGEEEVARVLLVVACVDVALRAGSLMHILQGSTQSMLTVFGLQDALEIHINLTSVHYQLYGGHYVWMSLITVDWNTKNLGDVSKAVSDVLECGVPASQALAELQTALAGGNLNALEKYLFYNSLGRSFLTIIVAFSATAAFYNGDVRDSAWAVLAALAAVAVTLIDAHVVPLRGTSDFIIAYLVALLADAATQVSGDVCAQAVELGALFWFFYGRPLVLGMMEVLDGFLVNGVVRFMTAVIKTFGLSLGVSLGAWAVSGGVSDAVLPQGGVPPGSACPDGPHLVRPLQSHLLFILCALGMQGSMHVGRGKVLVTLISQQAAWWTHVAMLAYAPTGTVIDSLAPAFACAMAANIGVTIMRLPAGPGLGAAGRWWDTHVVPHGTTTSPWSVAFPAVYLLVPGSVAFKGAFTSTINVAGQAANANFFTAITTVSICLALGIKLASVVFGILVHVFELAASMYDAGRATVVGGDEQSVGRL